MIANPNQTFGSLGDFRGCWSPRSGGPVSVTAEPAQPKHSEATTAKDVVAVLDEIRTLDLEIEVLVLLCERELDEVLA